MGFPAANLISTEAQYTWICMKPVTKATESLFCQVLKLSCNESDKKQGRASCLAKVGFGFIYKMFPTGNEKKKKKAQMPEDE